jgi:DNA-binding MarR family transcriptional regulator
METKDPKALTNARTFGSLLQKPYGYLQKSFYGELQKRGYPEIRPAHSAVFRNLLPGGSRIADLATEAGMTKQSMGYLVNNLCESGFLKLEPDPADARAKLVKLTRDGEAVVGTLHELSNDLVGRLANEFGSDWVSDMRHKLHQLEDFLRQSGGRTSPTP